jgi:hypothetical protein
MSIVMRKFTSRHIPACHVSPCPFTKRVVNKYGSVCHGYRSFFYGTLHMWARIDEEHNVKEKMFSFQTWKKLSNIIQWLVDLLSHGDTWHAGMCLEVNFLITMTSYTNVLSSRDRLSLFGRSAKSWRVRTTALTLQQFTDRPNNDRRY